MNTVRFEALKAGIGNRIPLTGFQNPCDYPLCVAEVQSKNELMGAFRFGNWATNTAFVWEGLAFVQRSHGGDEWLTLREHADGSWETFESINFYAMLQQDAHRCDCLLDKLAEETAGPMIEPSIDMTL